MRSHVNIHPFDGEIPKDWDFPDLWPTKADDHGAGALGLAPKQAVPGQALGMTVELLDEIISGRKQVLLWGWAEYKDVFPNTDKHITRFAVRIDAGGNPRDPDRLFFSYSFLAKYNCSDEECAIQGLSAGWTPRILEIG
jgi:hypothetical protein